MLIRSSFKFLINHLLQREDINNEDEIITSSGTDKLLGFLMDTKLRWIDELRKIKSQILF